jgi:hypothetical protein
MTHTRLFAVVSTAVVIGAVLAGLYVAGTPGVQRLERLDEQRVDDLAGYSRAVNAYWEKTERLPASLSALVDGVILRTLSRDPESETAYVYEVIDRNSYRLCAEFAGANTESAPDDFWAHESGLQCFEFEVGND